VGGGSDGGGSEGGGSEGGGSEGGGSEGERGNTNGDGGAGELVHSVVGPKLVLARVVGAG
jgi:hypothetical protein